MRYYKVYEDEKLVMIGGGSVVPPTGEEISHEEYNQLLEEIQLHAQKVNEYFEKVRKEEITIYEVPIDCRDEVEMMIESMANQPEVAQNKYGIDNAVLEQIIDDYTNELIEGGIL